MPLTVRLLSFLDKQNKVTLWGMITLIFLGLGFIDYVTGSEVIIGFFYLIPISLASWSLGKTPGMIATLVATIMWQGTNLLAGGGPTSPVVNIWNTLIRLGTFMVYSILLSEFRGLLKYQTELSRTDPLTGILNRRAFFEAAELELKKIERYRRPLTVIFIDLDNFKAVNDASGHLTGDTLLQHVAESTKHMLRGTDIVARLGGDEYAVLMPETDKSAAEIVIPRLQKTLLDEMAEAKWPVTFSIGILTCTAAPPSVEDTVNLADQLMYSAKRSGRNLIEYGSYPEAHT